MSDPEPIELTYERCKRLPVGTVIADARGYWASLHRHYIKTSDATWAAHFGDFPGTAEIDRVVSQRVNSLSPCPHGLAFVYLPGGCVVNTREAAIEELKKSQWGNPYVNERIVDVLIVAGFIRETDNTGNDAKSWQDGYNAGYAESDKEWRRQR